MRPTRETLTGLAWIVTAFTLGHSATLILAAAFDVRLPTGPVEAAIALSVLVSAVHAIRPLFPGREAFVAFGFGLIHGLAFATVVAGFGASVAARAIAILGFNLGIEAVQLALVLLLLPALVIGSHTRWYAPVRVALGAFAAIAALAWLVERASGSENAVAVAFASVLPPLGLALIALSMALAAWALFVALSGWRCNRPRVAPAMTAPHSPPRRKHGDEPFVLRRFKLSLANRRGGQTQLPSMVVSHHDKPFAPTAELPAGPAR